MCSSLCHFWDDIGRFWVDIGRFWVDIGRFFVDIGLLASLLIVLRRGQSFCAPGDGADSLGMVRIRGVDGADPEGMVRIRGMVRIWGPELWAVVEYRQEFQ